MGELTATGDPTGVGDLIRNHSSEILADWKSTVSALPHARELPGPLLLDDVPLLLQRIAAMADAYSHGEDAPPPSEVAEDHASARLDEGFDVHDLITEVAALRECVKRVLERSCDPADERVGSRMVDVAVDQTIATAVDRYTAARDRGLRAMEGITTTALQSRNVDAVLRGMLTILADSIDGVDEGSIFMLEGDVLRLHASVGLDALLTPEFQLAIGEGFAGAIAADRRPRSSSWASEDPSVRSPVLKARGIRALYGVPLLRRDVVIGVAHIGSISRSDFSPQDQRLFREVANRAAIAIDNSLLALRERAWSAAARALAGASTFADAIPSLLSEICAALGWDVGAYWRLDAAAEVLRFEYFITAPQMEVPEFEKLSREITFRKGRGLPGRAWADASAVWIRNISGGMRFVRTPTPCGAGLRSAMAFPLIIDGEVRGVFEFFSRAQRSAAEEGVHLTRLLASELGEFTRRLAAQERLEEEEARKAAILDAALDCIILMDESGRAVAWNKATERTFGYTADEAIGREMASLIIPPHLREAHRKGLARYLATGEQVIFNRRLEFTGLRRDGTEFPIELAVTRLPGEDPPLFTGFIRDITERKQLEETRERFVGILGHDLRNPIGAITLGAQVLLRSGDIPPHHVKTLERISTSSHRMTLMIRDLLDFTRGRLGGGIPVVPQLANLADITRDVVNELEAGTPGVEFELDITGDTRGEWDPERLAQVVSNLASNAVQHREAGSKIHLGLEGLSDQVVLEVKNAATCPPPELVSRLFDPFLRVESREGDPRREGLGLGLYISHEIVRAHGGEISARCTAEDGFTVTVRLPRRTARN